MKIENTYGHVLEVEQLYGDFITFRDPHEEYSYFEISIKEMKAFIEECEEHNKQADAFHNALLLN